MASLIVPARNHLTNRSMRDYNLSLVLHEIYRVGGCSRSHLCQATGLTPGAVTLLANELVDAGFIETSASMEAEGGRRKKQLVLSGSSYPVAVIELKPGYVRLVCETFAGEMLVDETYEEDFRGRAIEEFADFVAARVCDLRSRLHAEPVAPLRVVGLITSSPVRSDRAEVLGNVDFGWEMANLGELIRARLLFSGITTPVVMLKDADCAAWLEYLLIAQEEGAAPEGMLYLSSDESIGGAFIIKGCVYDGPLGTAMTIGHVQLNPEGERCACGKRGCLITYAGSDVVLGKCGMADFARAHGKDEAVALLRERWLAGEEAVREVVDRALRYLRVAIEVALTLVTADCVVLGGYLVDYLEEILAVDNGFTSLGVPGVTSLTAARGGRDGSLRGGLVRIRGALIDHAGDLMRSTVLDARELLRDTL